jgi:hypothetical protein
MATIELTPKGPFDLRLSAGFGFGPDTRKPEPSEPVMRLASAARGDQMRPSSASRSVATARA